MTKLLKFALVVLASLAFHAPLRAQVPVNQNLAEALKALPVPGLSSVANTLLAGLTPIRGGYTAKAMVSGTPVMLYLYGSNSVSQTLFLVVGGPIALPNVFNNSAWRRIAGSTVSDAIFSLSTIDFSLKTSDMTDELKLVVGRSYYGNSKLEFKSGFQMQGNVSISGIMKTVLESGMGLPVQSFLMRAGVAIPTPTDTNGQVALGLTLLNGIKNLGTTFQDLPEFYLELQTAPGSVVNGLMGMSTTQLTDAMFSVKNSGVVGFKGNLIIPGGKKFVTFFDTPLNPGGVMDFADFRFGLAAQSVTLEDVTRLALAMSTPKVPGGGFLRDVSAYQQLLQQSLKPLSAIEVRNPRPVGEYRYADESKPFPSAEAFNILLVGPGASMEDGAGNTVAGPMIQVTGNTILFGQQISSNSFYAGPSGLRSKGRVSVNLKFGPLGMQNITVDNVVEFTKNQQVFYGEGNVLGRSFVFAMRNAVLGVESPATCATPFSIKETVDLVPAMSWSDVMNRMPGSSVDPALINACTGDSLKAALKWISTTGQSLGGYTAKQASDKLTQIARDEYLAAKALARDKAENAAHEAKRALTAAGNFIKGLGGKRKKPKNETASSELMAGSVFDWDYYYDNAYDVVLAGKDLTEHWYYTGFYEGRQGSLEFSAKYYLENNEDVRKFHGPGNYKGALWHWLAGGIKEGRQGSPNFSIKAFINRYPDIKAYFGDNYEGAFGYWMTYGKAEGRSGAP